MHARSTLSAALLLSIAFAMSCGGGDGPAEPVVDPTPRPTSIVVLPENGVLEAIGDTIRYSGRVLDQFGNGIAATITWTSADSSIVTVGTVGDATAVSNGTTQVTATAGTATRSVPVTVAQIAEAILVESGDGQSATVGETLADPIAGVIEDSQGVPIPDLAVALTVSEGGGTLEPAAPTTDQFGRFEVFWTLGDTPGIATVTADAGNFTEATFTATAFAVPDLEVGELSISPATPTTEQPVDLFLTLGNPGGLNLIDVPVQVFVDGELVRTIDSGPVAGGGSASFFLEELGPFAAGPHELSVVVDPENELEESDEDNNTGSTTFTTVEATALESGTPVAGLTGAAGSSAFFTVEVSPEFGQTATGLQVSLTGGTGNADLYVRFGEPASTTEFDCSSTGGDNEETCVLDSPSLGTFQILVDGVSDYADVTLEATVTREVGPAGSFNIDLVFLSGATPAQEEAFELARQRWEEVITADVIDITFGSNPFPANACSQGQREVVDIVDDVRIYVNLVPIDGPSGVLGSAGPCAIRDNDIPVLGSMRFDTADLASLEANDALIAVILHEMGHVLGIGTTWSRLGLLQNPSLPSNQGVDTYFSGENAIAAFDAIGGENYPQEKVPVENERGPGSGDSHWRESVMSNELMTPTLGSGESPMSRVTIASLIDLGYSADPDLADDFSLGFGAPVSEDGFVIHLGDDLRKGPVFVVGRDGRILRVIPD